MFKLRVPPLRPGTLMSHGRWESHAGKYCGKDKDDRDSKWDFFILANFSHIESLSSLFTTQRKTSRFENPVSHDSPPAMTHESTGTEWRNTKLKHLVLPVD